MSTYYVDLDDQATSGHAGSSGDPYSARDFIGYQSGSWVDGLIRNYVPSGDTFKIRGSYEMITNDRVYMNPAESTIFEAWDKSLYGPWRLKYNGADILWFSGIFKDFIYYQTGNSNNIESKDEGYACEFYGSYLIPPSDSLYISIAGAAPTFKGCLLIGKVNPYGAGSGTVTDSIVVCSGSFGFSSTSVTYDNCVFTVADPSFSPAATDCQFSWSAPSMPAWNASQSAFDSDTLSAGINTPPQPGNPPYTGYTTGLWGTARTGIGALDFPAPATTVNYFSVSSVADGTSVLSTVNKDYLIGKIQADSTDTYFDEAAELSKVLVYYTHEDLRQQKIVIHSGTNLTGNVTWYPTARDGTWEKTRVKVYDPDGAVHNLNRAAIGTSEDLTHSGGSMTLNT